MRILLPGILAMAAIVASNILVQYPLGTFLTWGAFTYPFALLVNEIVNRFEGPAAARKESWAGATPGSSAPSSARKFRRSSARWSPCASPSVDSVSCGRSFSTSLSSTASVGQGEGADSPQRLMLTLRFSSIAFSASFTFLEPVVDVSWATQPTPLLGLGQDALLGVARGW